MLSTLTPEQLLKILTARKVVATGEPPPKLPFFKTKYPIVQAEIHQDDLTAATFMTTRELIQVHKTRLSQIEFKQNEHPKAFHVLDNVVVLSEFEGKFYLTAYTPDGEMFSSGTCEVADSEHYAIVHQEYKTKDNYAIYPDTLFAVSDNIVATYKARKMHFISHSAEGDKALDKMRIAFVPKAGFLGRESVDTGWKLRYFLVDEHDDVHEMSFLQREVTRLNVEYASRSAYPNFQAIGRNLFYLGKGDAEGKYEWKYVPLPERGASEHKKEAAPLPKVESQTDRSAKEIREWPASQMTSGAVIIATSTTLSTDDDPVVSMFEGATQGMTESSAAIVAAHTEPALKSDDDSAGDPLAVRGGDELGLEFDECNGTMCEDEDGEDDVRSTVTMAST